MASLFAPQPITCSNIMQILAPLPEQAGKGGKYSALRQGGQLLFRAKNSDGVTKD